MKIYTKFDNKITNQHFNQQAPLVFNISWNHENLFYPSKDWTDFGVVIMGWWVKSLENLMDSSNSDPVCFSFMDGDYKILAVFNKDNNQIVLQPKGVTNSWIIQPQELIKEFLTALIKIKNELLENDLCSKEDKLILDRGVYILELLQNKK